MKKKGNEIRKQIKMRKDNKFLLTFIVSFMLIMATSPLVLGLHEDLLVITFDPDADVDINVDFTAYNFSIVLAAEWSNTTGEIFTLYNNGTIAMDTEIRADNSSEGDMTINGTGVPPATDEFAIYIEDLDFPHYLNDSYVDDFDTALASNGYKSFDVCLLLGTNLSANHSWQTVNISFRGSII
jgi:hypothetical protein